MEKTVSEYLGEKNLHTTLRQFFHISALGFQRSDVADANAVDALHRQHAFAGIGPMHFRDVEQTGVFKIPSQGDGIRPFADQIQLVQNGFMVILDHFVRAEPLAIGDFGNPLGQGF